MSTLELPKSFDDFVDARKAGFLKVKEFVENGYERMKKHEHIRITKII